MSQSSHYSSTDKGELFNQYFHSVFNKQSALPSTKDFNLSNKFLFSISFTDLHTYDALSSTDPSKPSGVDEIPSKVQKHTAIASNQSVHHLFSLCLKASYIPQEWHTHQIIPIPKTKGSETSVNIIPSHYFVVFSKVLEKLIFKKTIDFLIATYM